MEENKNINEIATAQTAGNTGTYYTPVKSPLRRNTAEPMEKKDAGFMIAFGVLAFLFIHFAFSSFSLGYTLLFVAMFIVSTVYLHSRAQHISPFVYFCGLLSLAGAVANSIYSNDTLNFFNVILTAFLFAVYLGGISGALKSQGNYKLVINTALSALLTPLRNLFGTFSAFCKSFKGKKSRMNVNALIGAVLAVPFIAIIVVLLTNGDAAFSGLINKIFKNAWNTVFTLFGEAIITLFVAPFLVSYIYSLKKNIKVSDVSRKKRRKILANSLSVSFLCVISLTYLAYLFSQLAYFFSAFSGFLPKNYEYSESAYARRGFYEIFVICIINVLIITLVNLFTKKNENGKFSLPLKLLQCFICAVSILFIITAMAKMALNIQHFGLSVNRLLVSLLEIMMLVINVFIVIHIFFPKVKYMQAIIIICSVLFIGFVYSDVDAIVAKYNVDAYRNGKLETVDVGYLGHVLSDSAMPYIAELAKEKDADSEISERANAMLSNNYIKYSRYLDIDGGKMTNNHKMPFERINLSREIACNVIADYYNSLDSQAQKEFVDNGSIYFG